MSSYDYFYDNYEMSPVEKATIALNAIALVATIAIGGVTIFYSKTFGAYARTGATTWLLLAICAGALAFILQIAAVAVRFESMRSWETSLALAALHLPAVYNLFGYVAMGSVLFAQLEMAIGLHKAVHGLPVGKGLFSMPIARILGITAFFIAMVLNVTYFGVVEGYYGDRTGSYSMNQKSYDLIRAAMVLVFVLSLLFFLNSIGVLVYTCIAPTLQHTRKARKLAIAAAAITLIRSLYEFVFSCVYNIAVGINNVYVFYPEWLPVLSTIFTSITLVVTFGLLLGAANEEPSEASWTGQAHSQPSYNTQAPYNPANTQGYNQVK